MLPRAKKRPKLEKGQVTLWFPLVASSLVRAMGSTDATDKTVSTVTPDSVNTTNWSHFGKPRYCSIIKATIGRRKV